MQNRHSQNHYGVRARHSAIAAAVVLAAVGSPALAGAPSLGAHPRLFLKGDALTQLKALAAKPGSATARAIAICDDVIAHPSNWSSGGYQGLGFPEPFSACALAWVVRGDQASGAAAVKYWKALLDDYSAVGAGDGGDNVVQHDSGYSMRVFAPYAAIGYDWLQNAPGMTPDLLAHARERFNAWTTWYPQGGYHPDQPGSNYHAGYVVGATLIAVAEANEAGSGGDALWDHVVGDIMGKQLGPALVDGGVLDGGDWLEGWQYGSLSVAELAMSAKALRDSGVDMSKWSAWESQIVARTLAASVPDKSGAYIGGDSESTTPHMPVGSLTLDAALVDDASPDMKAYAVQTKQERGLHEDLFVLLDALAEINAPAPKALPANTSTWYYASGSRTLYARTDWSTKAVWMAAQCAPQRVPDHHWLNAGDVVMSRGSDHLLVDPTPYGGFSTLTGNAPTVPSPNLPATYQPSQGAWGTDAAVDFRWARQTQSGVIAARCDYAGQYQFQDTPTDIPRAVRDLVMIPYGTGDAVMIVLDDTVGATAGGLDVRFHSMGQFSGGAQARAHVGSSDVVAQLVSSSAGSPNAVTPGVGDCFSSPRGQCTIGRFATGEWSLSVPSKNAQAVSVLDAVAAGEAPAAATATSGSGWRATELDRGGIHIATVAIDPGKTSVTYTAKPGVHVVVGAPAGDQGRADVSGTPSGGGCAITVAAHGGTGGFDAKPVIATVGSDCSVTEDASLDPTMPGGGSGGGGGGAGSGGGDGGGSGSGDNGGAVAQGCSTSTPASGAPLALVGLALVRRRRRPSRMM
jgi:MYXO-CTERM domain-containing protein